jgi:hypothetical protein
MKKLPPLLLGTTCVLVPALTFAQDEHPDHPGHDHESGAHHHDEEHHDEDENEGAHHDHDAEDHEGHHHAPHVDPRHDHGGRGFSLGISSGAAYLSADSEFALSLHGHFLYEILHGPFGIGLGYEHLFDDHRHNAITAIFQYRITAPWSVSVSPGFTFEGNDFSSPRPSAHLETVYEFQIGVIDLGPSFEVALEKEGVHLTLAAHAGVHF